MLSAPATIIVLPSMLHKPLSYNGTDDQSRANVWRFTQTRPTLHCMLTVGQTEGVTGRVNRLEGKVLR